GCRPHVEPVAGQVLGHDIAHDGFVVHDQDPVLRPHGTDCAPSSLRMPFGPERNPQWPARFNGRMRWRLTVAGLAATCAAVAVAAVVHVLVYSVAFPPEAIAQRAVGITSGRVDSFFIQLLGHWAERLTVIGLS